MDKAKLTDYIKWLLSQLDEISSNDVDKGEVKTMLLSIIGEMYKHRDTNRIGSVQEKETEK